MRELAEGRKDPLQVCDVPRLGGLGAVDALEREGNPMPVVERSKERWSWDAAGQRRRHACLGPVKDRL